MKKQLITSLLTLTLMLGAVSPAMAANLNENTSKKYEIYLQDVERVRQEFVKGAGITNSSDQSAATPIGNVNVANTAYYIDLYRPWHPNQFGLYDEDSGAYVVDCDHLSKIGKIYFKAYVIGEDDEAWYINLSSGEDRGRITYVDRSDILKIYKDVTIENGVKHLKKWESISNSTYADTGDSRFYVDEKASRYTGPDTYVGLPYVHSSKKISISYIEDGKGKTKTINNVNDYYLALNNVSYVLMNGNEVGYYDAENKEVVNIGKVNDQGTEIYVSKDCKTASVYNAQKQLIGTVNL